MPELHFFDKGSRKLSTVSKTSIVWFWLENIYTQRIQTSLFFNNRIILLRVLTGHSFMTQAPSHFSLCLFYSQRSFFNYFNPISVSLSFKKKKYEVPVLSGKENFIFLHLIYKSNMRSLNKIFSEITGERKKKKSSNQHIIHKRKQKHVSVTQIG